MSYTMSSNCVEVRALLRRVQVMGSLRFRAMPVEPLPGGRAWPVRVTWAV